MKGDYQEFVAKLKKLYGKFDLTTKRFDKSSNSEIARELGYSDAQFSRLINETATEGEYHRAIQNVERILTVIRLEADLNKVSIKNSRLKGPIWFYSSIVLFLFILYNLFLHFIISTPIVSDINTNSSRDQMLKWTFETSFINPYTNLDELPEDCHFPCYKYQGKWILKNHYKIPFFKERSGFHYLAKDANMYALCVGEKNSEGDNLEGYEYQKHEIWYDKRELPIDSFIRPDNSTREGYYQSLDFSTDENFVKVATVHTFFKNKFKLDSISVHRSGKVMGRDLEFVSKESLSKIISEKKVDYIQSELNRIASNHLEDFSRPIACESAVMPNIDFHQIKDGDEISFNCELTTSRVGISYNKTYVMKDQYIKNNCRTN